MVAMLTQPEILNATIRKAAVTVVRAFPKAKAVRAVLYHLPVVETDGNVFMQRHNDSDRRINPLDDL